jgi:hypothetical protein
MTRLSIRFNVHAESTWILKTPKLELLALEATGGAKCFECSNKHRRI